MDKTTLYIPSGLHRRIKEIGRQEGRSQAAVIREALQDYVERQEEPPLLSLGAVAHSDLQGADVDDWLRANWHPDRDWVGASEPRVPGEASSATRPEQPSR